MARYPLGNDLHGNPLELPDSAIAWRIRRANGRPGRPQNVYDPETGRQLEVPLDATVDDLIDHGCGAGRYRLEAIDKDGQSIPGMVAFTEIVEVAEPRNADSFGEGHTERLVNALLHVVDTNSRVMEAMAQSFGPVRPAAGTPIVVQTEGGGGGESMKPEQMAQMAAGVTQVAKAVVEAWKGGGGQQ